MLLRAHNTLGFDLTKVMFQQTFVHQNMFSKQRYELNNYQQRNFIHLFILIKLFFFLKKIKNTREIQHKQPTIS